MKINIYSHAMMDVSGKRKATHLEEDPVGRALSTFAETPFAFISGPEIMYCRSIESFRQSLYMRPGPDRNSVAKMPPQGAREFVRRWYRVPTIDQPMEVIGEGSEGEGMNSKEDKVGAVVNSLGRKGQGHLPGKVYYAGKVIDVGSAEYITLIKAAMLARFKAIPALMDILKQTAGHELVFEPSRTTQDREFHINPAQLTDDIRKELGIV